MLALEGLLHLSGSTSYNRAGVFINPMTGLGSPVLGRWNQNETSPLCVWDPFTTRPATLGLVLCQSLHIGWAKRRLRYNCSVAVVRWDPPIPRPSCSFPLLVAMQGLRVCRLCIPGKLLLTVGVGWGGTVADEGVQRWLCTCMWTEVEGSKGRRRSRQEEGEEHAEGCRFYFSEGCNLRQFFSWFGIRTRESKAGNIFLNAASRRLLVNRPCIQWQCAKEQHEEEDCGYHKTLWDAFLGIDLFRPHLQQTQSGIDWGIHPER